MVVFIMYKGIGPGRAQAVIKRAGRKFLGLRRSPVPERSEGGRRHEHASGAPQASIPLVSTNGTQMTIFSFTGCHLMFI